MPSEECFVVLLGTGTPNADPDRSGPSLAVVARDKAYLVDFGPGVVRRAAAAHRTGIDALAVNNLDIAFLTHLHSDHTAGYADLILTPWILNRQRPLEVYGPPGLAHMTRHILTAYEADRNIRICGLEPINVESCGALAHEIGPGLVYEDDIVSVDAFEVNHGTGWLALGYQFTIDKRRIVISGDTAPIDSVIESWRDCDLLVHEVYCCEGYASRPSEWQNYHAHMHTSAREMGKIAAKVNPGKLILTHLLLWGSNEKQLIDEVKENYDGEVVCGQDLGKYYPRNEYFHK